MPHRSILVALVCLGLVSCAMAQGPQLKLPDFGYLRAKATDTLDITFGSFALSIARHFVKDVISGLTGIYVKSFTFDEDFSYPQADVDKVHKQLAAPGWQRLVEVRSRKEKAAVDVYLSMDGSSANGIAIIASEPREFTIVNIVAAVDLQKLRQLEGRFGIPKLELQSKTSQDNAASR